MSGESLEGVLDSVLRVFGGFSTSNVMQQHLFSNVRTGQVGTSQLGTRSSRDRSSLDRSSLDRSSLDMSS